MSARLSFQTAQTEDGPAVLALPGTGAEGVIEHDGPDADVADGGRRYWLVRWLPSESVDGDAVLRESGRDQMEQLEDGYLGCPSHACGVNCRPQVLLIEAPRVLPGVPDLRDLHFPVDFGRAVHDQPERVPVLDVHDCRDGVVRLSTLL